MSKLPLVAVVSLLAACAPAPHLDGGWPTAPGTAQQYVRAAIRIDDSVADWAPSVMAAMDGWRSLGVDFRADDGAARFVRCADGPIDGAMMTNRDGIYADCAWLALGTVEDHLREHSFAHELGHFIGLQHVAGADSLMYFEESERSPNAFSAQDAQEFYRVWGKP